MRFLTSIIALSVLSTPIVAENIRDYDYSYTQTSFRGWHGTVGALVMSSPEYSGSDSGETKLLPMLEIKYGDSFFASVQDGVGYNVVNNNTWRAGPVIGVDFGRKQDDASELNGMGDVDATAEIGAFVEYKLGKFKTKLEVRQATGGHDGMVADLGMTYNDRIGKTIVSFGPNLKYGDNDYTQTYYGVSAAQAAATPYNAYESEGGITSYGVGGVAVRPLEGNWSLVGLANYNRLAGDAADSPLVQDKNQFSFGIGLGYKF